MMKRKTKKLSYKRKCVYVIDGNKLVIDKPIKDWYVVQLHGVKVEKGGKKKLEGLVLGKILTIEPVMIK